MAIVKFDDVVVRANTREDRFNTEKIYYVGDLQIKVKAVQESFTKLSQTGFANKNRYDNRTAKKAIFSSLRKCIKRVDRQP